MLASVATFEQTAWITLKIFHGISSDTCSAAILRLLIIILEGMIEVCMVGKVGFVEMILDVQFSICYVGIYGHNLNYEKLKAYR